MTGDIQANIYTTDEQGFPSVCCRSDGSFVIAWHSGGQDEDGYGVFAGIFNSTGAALTGDMQVNTYIKDDQEFPFVCCRSDGSFVIAWQSVGQDGESWGVYFRVGGISVPSVSFLPFVILFVMQFISTSGSALPLIVGVVLLVAVVVVVLVFLLWKRII